MSLVKPAASRHMADYFGNQLTITIPSRKQWLQLPFLIFWLMGWTLGETAVLSHIARHGLRDDVLFLIVWTMGGLSALLSLLWILLGRETIVVNDGRFLIHQRQIRGIGLTRRYEIRHIRDLRSAPQHLPRRRQWPGWSSYGVIAFDYGAKTIRIGNSIDEAEAKQIIRALQKFSL